MATETDKMSGLERWCRLFKAQTWDELRKLAKEDISMSNVAEEVLNKNTDYATRKLAQDRADYLYWESRKERKMADLEKAVAEKDAIIEKLQAEIASLKSNN